MSGNGGNLHSLRDLPGTYEKSGIGPNVSQREAESKATVKGPYMCFL